MSSAVPIHPMMRLARQRLAVAARQNSVMSGTRRLTVSSICYKPARKGSIEAPSASAKAGRNTGNTAAASPSSVQSPANSATSPPPPPPPPSSSSSSRSSVSASIRAQEASTRSPTSPTTPAVASFKVADRRGGKGAEKTQSAPKTKTEPEPDTKPSAGDVAKAADTPTLEGVQKLLGKDVDDAVKSEPIRELSEGASSSDEVKLTEGIIIRPSASSANADPSSRSRILRSSNDSAYGTEQGASGSGDKRAERNDAGATTGGESGPPATTTQEQSSGVPRQILQYPFNTHEFIKRLQAAGFAMKRTADEATKEDNTSLSISKRHDPAEAIMDALHHMLVTRGQEVLDRHMNKTEVENQAYLFTAALAELRTELQVRARNDAAALRSMVTLLQREVDSLNQRMREDTTSMKHDIQVDMNNRKGEAKEEQNTLEQEIQDLNNRFTISISDLKTEIEQRIKWDATRRALTLFFGCIVIVVATLIAADYLTRDMHTGAAHADKSDHSSKGPAEVKTKSAEELGLVAIEDDEHGNRYV